MKIAGALFLAALGFTSWASGCVARADVVDDLPEPTEPMCKGCVTDECEDALTRCEQDADCDKVMDCAKACADKNENGHACLAGCTVSLDKSDYAPDVYRVVLGTCLTASCEETCDGFREYCGAATLLAGRLSLFGQSECATCVETKCCAEGMACGQDPACVYRLSCAISCILQSEECDDCLAALGDKGDSTAYAPLESCKNERCEAACAAKR